MRSRTALQQDLARLVSRVEKYELDSSSLSYRVANVVARLTFSDLRCWMSGALLAAPMVLAASLSPVLTVCLVAALSLPGTLPFWLARERANKLLESAHPDVRQEELQKSLERLSTFKHDGGQLDNELAQSLVAAAKNPKVSAKFWQEALPILSELSVAQSLENARQSRHQNVQEVLSEFQKDFGLTPQAPKPNDVVLIEDAPEPEIVSSTSPDRNIKL